MHYECSPRKRERENESCDSRRCHWSQAVIEAYVNYIALTGPLQWLCYLSCCYCLFLCSFCTSFSLYWFFAAAVAAVVLVAVVVVGILALVVIVVVPQQWLEKKGFYFLLTLCSCSCCFRFTHLLLALPSLLPHSISLSLSLCELPRLEHLLNRSLSIAFSLLFTFNSSHVSCNSPQHSPPATPYPCLSSQRCLAS